MDPESKQLLQETFKLASENNKMLKSIKHHQRVASFARSVYWLIVIALGIGAFYYLQPYYNQLISFFKDTGMTLEKFKGMMPK